MSKKPSDRSGLFEEAFKVHGFPLVRFDRKPIDKRTLRGFVIDWSVQLTMIQLIDQDSYQLNGYSVFSNRHVRKYLEIIPADFLAKAAQLNRLNPSRPARVSLRDWRDVFNSAGSQFPLVTIHEERLHDFCNIGKVLRTNPRAVVIRAIDTQARWEGRETYFFRNVTKVDFGGAYERLLQHIAAAPTLKKSVAKKRGASPRAIVLKRS